MNLPSPQRVNPAGRPRRRASLPAAFPLRQVHLDFHTSPFIPDVGAEFDGRKFARTLRQAHVNSVTVFAKCLHGMCYFPTRVGTPHPALRGRDLLGEMLEALRREDIRAPVYIAVGWEEDAASRHPEWRQMRADGSFARATLAGAVQADGWQFLDWVNPDYQDHVEALTREVVARYGGVDGFFYDILFYARQAHGSAAAWRFRRRRALTADGDETFARFEGAAQAAFSARFTKLLRGLQPGGRVFYNATGEISMDAAVGVRARYALMTHMEIESLPSGFWGYHHFPRLARSCGRWGRPWLGMTGRFQKEWGDFGGIKPAAALEYDCFRAQALGGGNSIGDQLPPRGTPDPAAYALIGRVYAQCAAAEPYYARSAPLPRVGVFTAHYPGRDPHRANLADEGALLMCDEIHEDASLLDEQASLDGFAVLVLPDATVVTDRLRAKLRAFHRRGGRLIVSHRAGCDAAGRWALDFLPLRFAGEVEKYPAYWRTRRGFAPGLAGSDRVIYSRGLNVVPGRGAQVLVDRVLPYFRRTALTYCSHAQTPPVAKPDRFPAVVAGRRFVYFADPIFSEYRESGNVVTREVWRRAMERLAGPPPFGAGLPTTILCVPRRRGRDLLLTLLHYVPVRKALERDVLEEAMGFAGEILRLPPGAATVRVFGTGQSLEPAGRGGFLLPVAKGRLLLEVPGYFRRPARGRSR